LELNPPNGGPVDYLATEDVLKERIIHTLKGFTRVFDLLINMKKPIVGHNMFSDLVMMCKQFHGPSPCRYLISCPAVLIISLAVKLETFALFSFFEGLQDGS